MRRFLIFVGIALVLLIILGWGVSIFNMRQEKSRSPEDQVEFSNGDLSIRVFYNRPKKNNREIFGNLVPYNEVWRTGANEATTFETNKELVIEGKTLPRGKYSLWTIPYEDHWTIIFNREYGQWGINSKGEPNRNPARDVLAVDVRSVQQEHEFEQFTIAFEKIGEDAEMVLLWDRTLVAMPFSW
jgi:Protein of unknown function (DUF2911).